MKALLIIATLAGLAASPSRAQAPILPGFWESINHSEIVIEQDSTSRKCITAELAESYLTGPANSHYTCIYDHSSVGDGKVTFGGQCTDNGGRKFRVDATGTYTPTSFSVLAQVAGNLYGLPFTGEATTKAHRISDVCPVAEKK